MKRWTLHHGDCLAWLRTIESESVDAIVTDPPAGIAFMGKAWDHHKGGRAQWVAWLAEIMGECLRVLKPGGHALVWSIPRTEHWTACAIEGARFAGAEADAESHATACNRLAAAEIGETVVRTAEPANDVADGREQLGLFCRGGER